METKELKITEHDVKVSNEIYTYLANKLNKHHEEWVRDNWRLRGLELARRQLHNEGDTSTEYAMQILDEEYERLCSFNEKDVQKLTAERHFLQEFENYSNEHFGTELHEAKVIFGY